jgi:hypothetical protein
MSNPVSNFNIIPHPVIHGVILPYLAGEDELRSLARVCRTWHETLCEFFQDPYIQAVDAVERNVRGVRISYASIIQNYPHPPSFEQRYTIASIGARRNPELLKDLPDDDTYRKVVIEVVHREGNALRYVSHGLRGDEEVVSEAVRQNPHALLHASSRLQNDEEIVSIAVRQDGLVLSHAHPNLRKNKKIVSEAVQQNGLALPLAHYSLRNDEEIVLLAICQNGEALQHADERLQCNEAFIVKAMEQILRTDRTFRVTHPEDGKRVLHVPMKTKHS